MWACEQGFAEVPDGGEGEMVPLAIQRAGTQNFSLADERGGEEGEMQRAGSNYAPAWVLERMEDK